MDIDKSFIRHLAISVKYRLKPRYFTNLRFACNTSLSAIFAPHRIGEHTAASQKYPLPRLAGNLQVSPKNQSLFLGIYLFVYLYFYFPVKLTFFSKALYLTKELC